MTKTRKVTPILVVGLILAIQSKMLYGLGVDRDLLLRENAYNIVDALPQNYVTDGSVDYTRHIQGALNKYDNIIFPGFPILVTGLRVQSNTYIYFDHGSRLLMKAGTSEAYNILRLNEVENVTLVNPVLIGDRKKRTDNKGEWGMGIGIYSSKRVRIINAKIYDCWGDGIYLGKSSKIKSPNYDIEISDAYCFNNRRNGISIISAVGLRINSPYVGNTHGHDPMYGIDIEPNDSVDELKDIIIDNPVTENNKGGGILIVLNNLYGGGKKVVDITINGHVDYASTNGFRVLSFRKKANNGGSISGNINLTNAHWRNNLKKNMDSSSLLDKAINLNVQNVKITVDNELLSPTKVASELRKTTGKNTKLNLLGF